MKTEHTLRYLLLRHLKKLERQVSPELFLEVTHSLHVAVDRHGYVVTWQARGERHEKTFPRGAFLFYRRGDTAAEAPNDAEDLRTDNDPLASAFAEEVLGVSPSPRRREAREPHVAFGLVEAALLVLATAAAGLDAWNAVAVGAVLVVEHGRNGRLRASVLFLPLAAFGPTAAATLGASAYALLQFLDPERERRWLRIALCLLATALAEARSGGPGLGWSALPVTFLALPIAVARSLYATPLRAAPLAMPFYAVGLRADRHGSAALCMLVVLGAGTFATAFAHRWLPVQRERELRSNG